jgi:hypothetical protein
VEVLLLSVYDFLILYFTTQINDISMAKDWHLDLHSDLKLNFDFKSIKLDQF